MAAALGAPAGAARLLLRAAARGLAGGGGGGGRGGRLAEVVGAQLQEFRDAGTWKDERVLASAAGASIAVQVSIPGGSRAPQRLRPPAAPRTPAPIDTVS